MFNYIYYDYESSKIACVYANRKEYLTYPSISSYLNQLCIKNGSTLKGRTEAFKKLTGARKFIPVFVSDDIIYFPTASLKACDCLWIRYEAIHHVEYKEKTCILFFKDATRLLYKNGNRMKGIFQSIQRYKLITTC
ncbi:MAG: competence protein ComK [Holdemanella sp.]|nr:competence protein ComK [Holdemanella sp.]